MKIFLLYFFLSLSFCKAQSFDSAISLGNAFQQRVITSITDKKGNLYLSIKYDSAFTINKEGVPVLIEAERGTNVAIIKFDSNLNYQWHCFIRSYSNVVLESNPSGYSSPDFPLALTSGGDLYCAATIYTNDSFAIVSKDKTIASVFNPKTYGVSKFGGISNPDYQIGFVTKITSTGTVKWVNYCFFRKKNLSMGMGYFDVSNLGADKDESVTFTVFKQSKLDSLTLLDFNGNITSIVDTSLSLKLKFDSVGGFVSIPQILTKGGIAPSSRGNLETDKQFNHYYILNYDYPYLLKDDTVGNSVLPAGASVHVLYKTDADHRYVWSKILSFDLYGRERSCFSISPSGDRLYYGKSFRSDNCYSESGFYTGTPYPNNGGSDFLVACIDSSGNTLWERTFGGLKNDSILAIVENINRDIYLVGQTTSSVIDFNPTQAHFTSGNSALFIAVFDSSFANTYTQDIQGTFSEMGWNSSTAGTKSFWINFLPSGQAVFNGWFTNAINFPCTTITSMGKDDIFIAKFTPRPHSIDTFVCKSLKSPSGKYTWDSSGTYFDIIPNVNGCDSLLTFRLKVLQSKNTIDTSVCYSLKSPSGKYFYEKSGTYKDTVLNHCNCDSILTVNVTILNTKHKIDTTYCGTYLTPSGKIRLKTSGLYYDTIPNSKNCDSIIAIQFTQKVLTDTIYIQTCKSYVSPSGRFTYQNTGIYQDTVSTAQQCDSIIVVNYTRMATYSTLNKAVCDSFVSPSGRFVYSTSGVYKDTVTNYLGCDSIIDIHLNIIPIILVVSKSNDISCDTLFTTLKATAGLNYEWIPANSLNNSTIENPIATPNESTVYTVIAKDNLGCMAMDSIKVLVNKSETINSLPNVITPNNDGLNDCYMLSSAGDYIKVTFTVFNRWGTVVFESTSPLACWDGKDPNGHDVSAGVYYFLINGITSCDTQIKQNGIIHLIR